MNGESKILLTESALLEVMQQHYRRFVTGVEIVTDSHGRMHVQITFKEAKAETRLRCA
jgi:hypothetical protein